MTTFEQLLTANKAPLRILIMCGDEAPARALANACAETLAGHELRFVEEKLLSFKRSLSFSWKRLKNKGPLSLLGCYCFYLRHFIKGKKEILREYRPLLRSSNLSRDKKLAALVKDFAPQLMIIGFCGILRPDFLRSAPCPIINLHPGINPRYRGLGNIWAFYEKRPDCAGFTIHEVDEGVDTGRRLAVAALDFQGLSFEDIDIYAADQAARHLARMINQGLPGSVPEPFRDLPSRFYGVPTLGQYLKARDNYRSLYAG